AITDRHVLEIVLTATGSTSVQHHLVEISKVSFQGAAVLRLDAPVLTTFPSGLAGGDLAVRDPGAIKLVRCQDGAGDDPPAGFGADRRLYVAQNALRHRGFRA